MSISESKPSAEGAYPLFITNLPPTLSSVDGYRVTRNVPLPYVMPGSTVSRPVEDEDMQTRQARVLSFFSNLSEGLVKNFRPITKATMIPALRTRTLPSRSRSMSVKKPIEEAEVVEDSSAPTSEDEAEGSDGVIYEDSDEDEGPRSARVAEDVTGLGLAWQPR